MLISNRNSLQKTLKRSPPAMSLTWTHIQHQDRSIPSSTCSDKEQLRRDRFATRYQASSFAKAWYSPLPLGVLAPLHLPRMIRKSSWPSIRNAKVFLWKRMAQMDLAKIPIHSTLLLARFYSSASCASLNSQLRFLWARLWTSFISLETISIRETREHSAGSSQAIL